QLEIFQVRYTTDPRQSLQKSHFFGQKDKKSSPGDLCQNSEIGPSSPATVSAVASAGKSQLRLVGARGFEPPTSRSQTERTTRLCYAPIHSCEAYIVSLRRNDILASAGSAGQGLQEITRIIQRLRSVTDTVLGIGIELSKRQIISIRNEYRIVSKQICTASDDCNA